MSNFVPVGRNRHGQLTWTKAPGYGFAARQSFVPVVGHEISGAAANMPLALVAQNQGYMLIALLSLEDGVNLFVDPAGRWIGGYVPATFRSYPFRMAKAEEDGRLILAVDEASGLVSDRGDGEPFFNATGGPATGIAQVMELLTSVEQSRMTTDIAVRALAEAGVIAPWEVKVRRGSEDILVPGLFRVDEAAINRLDDQAFLKLRTGGALALAYGQILSMARMDVLSRLADMRAKRAETLARVAQQAQPQTVAPGLDFMLAGDEKLTF